MIYLSEQAYSSTFSPSPTHIIRKLFQVQICLFLLLFSSLIRSCKIFFSPSKVSANSHSIYFISRNILFPFVSGHPFGNKQLFFNSEASLLLPSQFHLHQSYISQRSHKQGGIKMNTLKKIRPHYSTELQTCWHCNKKEWKPGAHYCWECYKYQNFESR